MNFIDRIGDCFLEHDGSLPGIELAGLSPQEVSAIYLFLRSRSRLSPGEPTFWDNVAERDVPVDSVPDAAALVASGWADAFHLCVEGLSVGGIGLPELGVFVFADSIELDYRMGPHWTEDAIRAFFELLFVLAGIAPSATIGSAEVEGIPNPDAFLRTWEHYRLERTSGSQHDS